MKAKILTATVIAVLLYITTPFAGDPPHNAASGVSCSDCHGATLLESQSPFWTDNTDDAAYCAICMRCHTLGNVSPYNGCNAPPVVTHKEIKCTICHHNHDQDQIYFGKNDKSNFFQATGTATLAVYDSGTNTTTITYSSLEATDPGSDWAADLTLLAEKTGSGRGGLLIPDTTSRQRWTLYIIESIDDPASNTIKVKGNATEATSIAIIYGQLIRREISYDPVHSTPRSVKLYNQEGTYAFAHNDQAVDVDPPDGILDDSTPDGNCQVCHENTNHWRNDGTKSENHYSGQNCMRCHSHTSAFLHGGGAGGTGCIECHGHDDGSAYDDDMAFPNDQADGVSIGAGSYQSHSTHTETDSDDAKGPGIYCDTCHDIDNFPYFKTGTDSNSDGIIELSETDVCDTCHSQGGTYDGLDDPVIGAKQIWTDGAYAATDDSTLLPGKEKWCATCHDESPSEIQSVNAPNVIGDEDGSYIYGTGWGYYKTGHGLPGDEPYPSKGGFLEPALKPGVSREVECGSCHDFSTAHIDGEPRTFNDNDDSETPPSVYRQGYRLKLVDGEEPMQVPWKSDLPNGPARYRLCAECHITRPFTGSAIDETNLVTAGINRHYEHLQRMPLLWANPDFEGSTNTSRPTCTICHNVHGSTQLAMVRDGKLVDRWPGMEMWYYNEDTTLVDEDTTDPPDPEDTPLAASDGNVWKPWSSKRLCSHCHGGSTKTIKEPRDPFQDVSVAPTLDWTGENGYVSDGANPDSGVTGSTFIIRVKYTDTNNDAPTQMQVWIDQDNNTGNGYEDQLDMNEDDPTDENYIDGKIYTLPVTLNNAVGNIKNYRFYAANTPDGSAVGSPTQNSSVYVFDTSSGGGNTPTLNWTGEDNYTDDGINPDSGNGGETSFTFRVDYTDESSPALIQVWIDEDDNGAYGADEKFDMTEDAPSNRYTLSRVLNFNGDGTLNFIFYATDGTLEATGDPTAEQSVSLTNNIPILSWTGETNYTIDGVHPDGGEGGSLFTFRVKYSDGDNIAPNPVQVWVDTDNSGVYDAHEKFNLTWDSGDGDYRNGEFYSTVEAIPYVGDGSITYRFYASDGADAATGVPVSDIALEITAAPAINNAPVLSWTAANCLSNGVRPGVGAEQVDFEFKVIYTDDDNECASDILLLIDEDDNGTYESDEKHIMTAGDSAACDVGRLYEITLNLASAGDEDLNYSFYATDSKEAATGTPVENDSTVTVIDDAIKVRPSGGAGWLTTIQAAEDSSFNSSTIVVYPNDDFTAATYAEDIEARTVNLIMRSACGPDLTIIDGTGSAVLLRADNQVFDGFSVTDAAVGIYVNPGPDNVTIKNNKIYGNSQYGINVNSGINTHIENNEIYNNLMGIRANVSSVDIKNCDIHHNENTGWGGGIYFNSGVHSITDSLIRENSAGTGGGISFNGVGAGTTVTNTTIRDNWANAGGGLHFTGNSKVTLDKCTITGNQANAGGGMYVHLGETKPVFKNSIFAENQANGTGGVAYVHSGQPSFVNVTFANNKAAHGGVFGKNSLAYYIVVRNSIFWGNEASEWGDIASRYGACANCAKLLDVSHSYIPWGGAGSPELRYAGKDGEGVNIYAPQTVYSEIYADEPEYDPEAENPNEDEANNLNIEPDLVGPLFAGDGNYHILTGSPVIDQAHADYAPADDIDGEARPIGAADDMGADEYFAPVNSTTAGIGAANAAVASNTSIAVSMPYIEDANNNNTYTVDYKLSSDHTTVWTNWVTDAANTASPYTTTITGLIADETYDVRMTYNDEDGVFGKVQRAVSGIDLTPHVNLTTASQSVVEDVGTVTVTATLSWISGSDVTVPFTVSGTATGGGTDHDLADGNIIVTAGQLTGTTSFTVIDDSLDESSETVIVTMGTPVNASAGVFFVVHTVTITDNDAAPSVTFTSGSQTTADESGTATITAQLSAASGMDVIVPFTVNGASTATGGGTDYSITASPVTITAGNTTADITVTIATDSDVEDDETVIVDMGSPTNATQGATTTHTATITDDD